MSKLDQVVFLVENGRITETAIRTLQGVNDGFTDTTTTPQGVGPCYHIRGAELWTWGHQGSFPKLVRSFETEKEAVEALEDSFAHDFWNCPNICAFPNRASAEEYCLELPLKTATS